jgi:hypothetical protein
MSLRKFEETAAISLCPLCSPMVLSRVALFLRMRADIAAAPDNPEFSASVGLPCGAYELAHKYQRLDELTLRAIELGHSTRTRMIPAAPRAPYSDAPPDGCEKSRPTPLRKS